MKVKLDCDKELTYSALKVALSFDVGHPDSTGFYHGVVYSVAGKSIYAYRTTAGTIVVRECG